MLLQLTTFSTAFAKSGGAIAGGGGNTLNGIVIEEYQTENPFKELPNLLTAKKQTLSKIENIAPDFAKDLQNEFENRTWYVLPVKFNELSSERTGLNFKTDQPAYQNEEEVFISLPQIETMADNAQLSLFQHEIIMMGLKNKDEAGHTAVRKVMALMKKQNLSEVEFVNKIGDLDFGRYLTKTEKTSLEYFASEYKKAIAIFCKERTNENESRILSIRSKVQAMTSDAGEFTYKANQKAYDLLLQIIGDTTFNYERGCSRNL